MFSGVTDLPPKRILSFVGVQSNRSAKEDSLLARADCVAGAPVGAAATALARWKPSLADQLLCTPPNEKILFGE